MKRRRSVHKQDGVVKALWGFAGKLQRTPDSEKNCMLPIEGTRLKLEHVVTTLTEIMEVFGYDVVPVE